MRKNEEEHSHMYISVIGHEEHPFCNEERIVLYNGMI
jgi:hypothetical protein